MKQTSSPLALLKSKCSALRTGWRRGSCSTGSPGMPAFPQAMVFLAGARQGMWQTWVLHGRGPEKRARRAFKKIYGCMLLIAEVTSLSSPCSSISKSCIETGGWFPARVRPGVASCWLLPQRTWARTSLLISPTASQSQLVHGGKSFAGFRQPSSCWPSPGLCRKQQDIAEQAVGPDGAGARDGGGLATCLLFLFSCAAAPLIHGTVQ